MKWKRSQHLTIAGVLLGFLASCTERNTPTALSNQPTLAFDASASLTSLVTDPLGDAKLNHHNSLDTDPTTAPPDNNGNAFPFEFFVDVEWDGTQFTGKLYDRRPLLTGGEAVVTPVSFTIEGAEIRLFVAASALESPSAFGWLAGTLSRHSEGINAYQTLDVAPNSGFAAWPQ